MIVVGHRAGLMAQMDKLAVLNDGVLEAFGPAAAVLARMKEKPPRTRSMKEAAA